MTTGSQRRQRGHALLLALLTAMTVAGMIAAASGEMTASRQGMELEFRAEAQARSLAEAGLVDAYAWLRRQVVQPVTAFAPRRDLLANPPVNETDDPDRGLVRDFEVSPGLWGRYEVLRGNANEPFVDGNGNGIRDLSEAYTDVNGDGRWSPASGTRDVTAERGLPGSGVVWFVESRGTLFSRPRADLPLGEGPNMRLSRVRVATEVRRLTIAPPADATICTDRLDDVVLGDRARLRGTATGLAGAEATGSPSLLSGSEVLTTMTSTHVPEYAGSYESIYGVDLAQLKSMADVSTDKGITGVPTPIPDFSLIVIEGDVTFDATNPLRGTAVVIVHGDVTIASGSNSFFSGVLHASGDITMRGPAYMRGTLIANGRVDLMGTGGDYVEIDHDPDGISRLLQVMGQYRLSKTTYRPGAVLADGRPMEALGASAIN